MNMDAKTYLEQIKLEGEMKDLMFKAQQVEVAYNGETMTLADALTAICNEISALPTTAAVKAAIDSQPTATDSAAGLMSAGDKARLDAIGKVWVGKTAPEGMRDGDLFIRVVSQSEQSE